MALTINTESLDDEALKDAKRVISAMYLVAEDVIPLSDLKSDVFEQNIRKAKLFIEQLHTEIDTILRDRMSK